MIGCSTRNRVRFVKFLATTGGLWEVHSLTPPQIRPRNQAIKVISSRRCHRLRSRVVAHVVDDEGVDEGVNNDVLDTAPGLVSLDARRIH